MMRIGIALVLSVLLLGACGGTTPARSTAHSPAADILGTLNCRLPVAGFVPNSPKGQPDNGIGPDGQPNQKGAGGFLDLPSGRFTHAADSDRSYIAGARSWLPVQPQAVAPDQRSYVAGRTSGYSPNTPPTTTLFLVDVLTRREHLLFKAPDGDMADVLAFTNDGIYVVTEPSMGGGASELEVIDAVTGAPRSLPGSGAATAQRTWVAVSGDAAWGMDVTNPQGSQSQPSAELVRLGFRDGSLVEWYDSPGLFTVIGFDAAHHPILLIFGSSASASSPSIAVLPGRNQTVVTQAKGGVFQGGRGAGITDEHGTWFGSPDGGIWLDTPAGDFEKVTTVPPQPGGTGQPYDPSAWRTIAGPCV